MPLSYADKGVQEVGDPTQCHAVAIDARARETFGHGLDGARVRAGVFVGLA